MHAAALLVAWRPPVARVAAMATRQHSDMHVSTVALAVSFYVRVPRLRQQRTCCGMLPLAETVALPGQHGHWKATSAALFFKKLSGTTQILGVTCEAVALRMHRRPI